MKKRFRINTKPIALFLRRPVSKLKIRRILRQNREIFIELGAGKKKGTNGWLTLDIKRKCDIVWDLRRGIPFPDESVRRIYSSHFFEHLSYYEIQAFLDECLRVLKPGGQFSICVPDARPYIEAYVHNTELDSKLFFDTAYNATTKIDYVNYIAYMGGCHKYMFDKENLVHLLASKGMKNARLRDFDPSIDLEVRRLGSIYAVAEK